MNKKAAMAGVVGGIGIVALALAPAQATDGRLMDLTLRVKEAMAGMPPIAPRTLHRKICMQPGRFDPQALVDAQSRTGCEMKNYRENGTTITFDEVCAAPMTVTSHGLFHLTGGTGFVGTMHTEFSAAGHPVTVDTDYAGKQAGSCHYSPPQASR